MDLHTSGSAGARDPSGDRPAWRVWLLIGGVVGAIAALTVATALFAVASAGDRATGQVASSDPDAGAEGPSEGIKVHGDWTIDILDPDGTLVRRVEFENVLRSEGAQRLVQALATGQVWPDYDDGSGPVETFASWALFLADTGTLLPEPVDGVSPCAVPRLNDFLSEPMLQPSAFLSSGCWILTPDVGALVAASGVDPATLPGYGFDLDIVGFDLANGNLVRLAGSVVATQDGQVDFVESFVYLWVLTVSFPTPSGQVVDVVDFTGTGIDPIEVLEGQEIRVTFELSFQ